MPKKSKPYLAGVMSTKQTPQSEAVPDKPQVENSAGGYVFPVDDFTRTERFLILGSEGGSYYAAERPLTLENAEAVKRAIGQDGKRVVDLIVSVSDAGRAPKNDPALFALAMCASFGDDATRSAALDSLPKVARIGTHLFHFVGYVDSMRGWGRSLKRAVQNWYTCRSESALAMQVVKYAQRDGWSHRDLLRLAKPVGRTLSPGRNAILRYATNGEVIESAPELLRVVSKLDTLMEKELVKAIEDHGLPMEVVPTDKRTAKVYDALLPHAGLTWLFRNLGNLGKSGVLKPLSSACMTVCARLTDEAELKKQRVHPLQALVALNTYQSGHGFRGSGEWPVVPDVVDALDNAFYLAFGAVEPSRARTLLALDVSGSMDGGSVAGLPGISPRVGSAAMAMVTYRTEPICHVVAFSDGTAKDPIVKTRGQSMWMATHGDQYRPMLDRIDLSRQKRLDDVVRYVSKMPMGGTDCALPMLAALDGGLEVDCFVIYTDSETWAGDVHPCQALAKYRRETGINAKLVVVGMVSNGFSIADPSDGGMMDVVGFDTSAPNVISDFCRVAQ